jgi:hypothetical protein
VGWRIPDLLNEYGLSHKVLFTYLCKSCNLVFPSYFQDSLGRCPKCGASNCEMPSTQFGVSTETMASIHNLFDIYVQYSNSEGAGIGSIESAACGVPVVEVDYSAMADIGRKLRGNLVPPKQLSRESATGCNRAVPDNDEFVRMLTKFFNLPEQIRLKKGFETHTLANKHYNYNDIAEKWEQHLDTVPITEQWSQPPQILNPPNHAPDGLTIDQLVQWAILNVLGKPERLNTLYHFKLVRDLNNGRRPEGGGAFLNDMSLLGGHYPRTDFTPNHMLELLYNERMEINKWERRRCGLERWTLPSCISHFKPGAHE